MSTSNGNANDAERRGEYGNVPLHEEEDIVQLKKLQSTAPPEGLLNHPALPILCYCMASILMTVVNKYVVSGAKFNMNCLMLVIQSVVCVACVLVARSFGFLKLRPFDMEDVKKWFPISFMLSAVIYTGSKSIQYLPIPVFTIFKNLTIILIAYGEVLWFGGKVTSLTMVSFALMVLSSVIAAWSDIANTLDSISNTWASTEATGSAFFTDIAVSHFSGGYLWMFLNCIASAAYVLTMRKRIKSTGFSDWDTMFYNNFLSIPVLLVFSFLTEDWSQANLNVNFPADNRGFLLSAIAFSGAAAVGISYTTAWCIRATSSTTYSMVGSINKLPVALSGMVFFNDPVTLGSVSAVTCGFGAGVVYAVAKNNQSKADKARGTESVIPLHQRKG